MRYLLVALILTFSSCATMESKDDDVMDRYQRDLERIERQQERRYDRAPFHP